MGMAASQARLLSITARLSNNEQSSESVAYSKQRLADQTQQITNEYNEALDATKLTVLTGFNGAVANYEDISYNLMTGLRMAENSKQYFVTDTKGRVLVTEQIADAYTKSKGNYNEFLAILGYFQSDITVQLNSTDESAKKLTEKQIHEAWDKYFATVGINKFMPEHDFGFSFTETYALGTDGSKTEDYSIGDGYVGFIRTAVNEDGTVKYAYSKDSKNFLDENNNIIEKDAYSEEITSNPNNTKKCYDNDGNEVSEDSEDIAYIKYFDTNNEEILPDTYSDEAKEKMVYDYNQPLYLDKDGNEFTYDKVEDEFGNITYVLSPENEAKIIYDPINYEGTTQESRDLYDYAMAITEAYLRVNINGSTESGTPFNVEFDMNAYKTAANTDNNSALKYYRNIFDKIQSSDFITYTDTPAKAKDNGNYIYSETAKGTSKVAKNPLKDNYTFEAALRDGSLRLQYYSATKKEFVSTTISEDNCIQEVADERAIAKAESKYNQDMADLENKDKKHDLELKKLDTEHKALETEYEAVKSVVDKNVETSFKIFS